MKVCRVCKIEKELGEFHFRKCNNSYRAQCKVCRGKVNKRWADGHKGEIRDYQARWFQENKERVVARRKLRRYTIPEVMLACRLRSRLARALDGTAKESSTMKLLGCTAKQFREHIQSQFVDGMGWNQRGKWVIDHELPIAAFDLTKSKHQRYAFHWSNCQPMFAEDNLRKSDKYCPKELKAYLASTLMEYSLKRKDENN